LGMQNLLCAPRLGPLTAALLQLTIQNSQFRIAQPQVPFFDRPLTTNHGPRTSHTLPRRRVLVPRVCLVAVAFEGQIDEAVKQL
jgi:hypothetical protein